MSNMGSESDELLDSSDEESEEEDAEQDVEELEDGDKGNVNVASSIEAASEDELNGSPEKLIDLKEANVAALLRDNLSVKRQPLLPKMLSVPDASPIVRRPYKSPIPGAPTQSRELLRRLAAQSRVVPWSSHKPFRAQVMTRNLLPADELQIPEMKVEASEEILPPGIEPLILWHPEEDPTNATEASQPITVDPLLTKFLRPHQREGVQFMFECVAGLRDTKRADESLQHCGCILADDMGLGKTLQSVTLLWTLLQQGFEGWPMVKRVVIVTPTSLVSNWESELQKWLHGRVSCLALCESSKSDVIDAIRSFLTQGLGFQVLIISYETFRLHAAKLQEPGSCDLLVCDEAHRLKNDKTLTNQALAQVQCNRRILLSGTPIQNDLEEFYAMVNFTNPGVLGDAAAFRRYYENPIVTGREPGASDEERSLARERQNELSDIVNGFILRRTNNLLSNHLPPKIHEVVCCKLSDLQLKLYEDFIQSKNVKQVLAENTKHSARVLSSITQLKKLCNHPKLIFDTIRAGGTSAGGFKDSLHLFPPEMLNSRTGSWTGGDGSWVELSGKMNVLARLLAFLRRTTDDRIVLVSNFTQTLDLFAQLCRERQYPFIRLDGSTSVNKRQKLVVQFNDPVRDEFAFLLSSKAGGCGLNLVGGNRLVLFDPDWNPANDKQAAARVWRDGQKKRVFIYRFLATGTIEEKVFQRQISKEGLQTVVDSRQAEDSKGHVNAYSTEDLRDLFSLQGTSRSHTHDSLNCKRCSNEGLEDSPPELPMAAPSSDSPPSTDASSSGGASDEDTSDIGQFAQVAGVADRLEPRHRQVGKPREEDLALWGHHADMGTVPDTALRQAAGQDVSFVMTWQVGGKLAPLSPAKTRAQGPEKPASGDTGSLGPPQLHSKGKGAAAIGAKPEARAVPRTVLGPLSTNSVGATRAAGVAAMVQLKRAQAGFRAPSSSTQGAARQSYGQGKGGAGPGRRPVGLVAGGEADPQPKHEATEGRTAADNSRRRPLPARAGAVAKKRPCVTKQRSPHARAAKAPRGSSSESGSLVPDSESEGSDDNAASGTSGSDEGGE